MSDWVALGILYLVLIVLPLVITFPLILWMRRVTPSTWPGILRPLLFYAVKYGLALLGAYILIGLGTQALSERRVNLGVAFLVYLAFTGTWWIVDHRPMLFRRLRR